MFRIKYKELEEREVLEAKVYGELTLEASMKISSETRTKAKEKGLGLLKDLTEMKQKVSLSDAYEFFNPTENKQLKPALKNVVTAVIVDDAKEKLWDFWELVSLNNGLISRVFEDRSDALHWIESKRKNRKQVKN